MNKLVDERNYLWIALLIPFLTLADIGMTVVNVQMYQQEYPELEYEDIEANRFATWGWRQFGFWNGTYIVGGIILALVCTISFFIHQRKLPVFYAGVFLGAYAVVLQNHIRILVGWFI